MPVLSVIIPTHNRARYAIPTIKSILQSCDDVEVIVSDTSNDDLISPAFAHISEDHRLKILRPGKPLNVVENFEYALSVAHGTYLTFIGDDDFVSPNICEVARWANEQGVDAIKNTFPVFYYWPDFRSAYDGDRISGTLRISKFTGKISIHDPKKALDVALDSFGTGVLDMPRAYSGIISKDLANRIVEKYGQLFGGVSPDIYSAALISVESKNCVKIDYPLIIPGASQVSGAGLSKQGKHIGKLRENAYMGAFINLVWDARIPEFYSVPTVWAYSLLKAIEVAGCDTSKVNFMRLYVKCFVQHPRYHGFIAKPFFCLMKKIGWFNGALLIIVSLYKEIEHFSKRLVNKFVLSKTINVAVTIKQINNTESAAEHLSQFLKTNNKKLRWFGNSGRHND